MIRSSRLPAPLVASVVYLAACLSSAALGAPRASVPGGATPLATYPGQPPRLAVRPSPCPGPDCTAELRDPSQPYALGRRIVYLNFDGASITSSKTNEDARSNISAIAAFDQTLQAFQPSSLYYDGGLTRQQIIDYTVEQIEDSYAAFDVQFTTTRPTSGNYTMVIFAGGSATCESVTGEGGCAGISLRDCGDIMPNNISLIFTYGLRYQDLPQTASHELGHTFGLDHIDNDDAIMYFSIQDDFIPTEFGAGPIRAADQAQACNGDTYQDSRERLSDNIGPAGQDVLPPSIAFTSPQNGATLVAGSPVVAEVNDIDSAVQSLTFEVNDMVVDTRNSPPWQFTIPAGVPQGPAILRLRAMDTGGNSSSSKVAVTISGDIDCQTDDDCPAGLMCGNGDTCEPDVAPGALGATCTSNDECSSGTCGTLDDESLCTKACSTSSDCPDGFTCKSGTACWPKSGDTGGCNLGGDASGPALLIFFGLGLVALRRRRAPAS